jgi:hypothetical protein
MYKRNLKALDELVQKKKKIILLEWVKMKKQWIEI